MLRRALPLKRLPMRASRSLEPVSIQTPLSPLRLTYGTVKGFEDAKGKFVQPYTAIGGLYERATGAPPYNLPESWLTAKGLISPTTPMNFCTTNDTIGGNSGSPVIDKNANIVGLLFDGNIFSLGGDYGYDAAKNRSIAVDSRALTRGNAKGVPPQPHCCQKSKRQR